MDFKKHIIYETKSWMAINKPSGLIVEQNPFERDTIEVAAWHYLKSQVKRPFLGIVHRLDRVTSGVLLLAKKKQSLRLLNLQFAQKTIQKTYFAVVTKELIPSQGTLNHWLEKRNQDKRAVIHESPHPNAKAVSLDYIVIDQQEAFKLLEIRPHTGRFHQIRAQLSHIGYPIVGDKKYGSTIDPAHRKIALHAGILNFSDPETAQPMTLKAPFPKQDHWLLFQ